MDTQALEETRSTTYTKPWRRYFAKSIDLLVFGFVVSIPLGIALAIAAPGVSLASPLVSYAFVVATVIAAIPLEAACLSRFGTTFGKFLMRTTVVGADGGKISFGKGAMRTLKSYGLGLAFGAPLVSLFTMMANYNHLENEGVTYWDNSENTYVVHTDMRLWNWVIGVTLVVFGMALGIYDRVAGAG